MATSVANLNDLKKKDIYSLMMFVLYKLKDIPEFSAISELSYILDKDNLLKMCEYFGGLTIQIPTLQELEDIVYSLLMYQYVNIDGMEYDKAISIIGFKSQDLRTIKKNYAKICKILEKYQFVSRIDEI